MQNYRVHIYIDAHMPLEKSKKSRSWSHDMRAVFIMSMSMKPNMSAPAVPSTGVGMEMVGIASSDLGHG